VKGKGMPFFKDAMGHGNLYIKFLVQMPKRGELNPDQLTQLSKIIPGPKITPLKKEDKFEYLEDFVECDMNPNAEGGKKRERDEDDDEENGHGGR
jgi:DnaJ-class molecular chaperone